MSVEAPAAVGGAALEVRDLVTRYPIRRGMRARKGISADLSEFGST